MKPVLTDTARDNLAEIYDYHAAYTLESADKVFDEITDFLFSILPENPQIGVEHNADTSVRKFTLNKRYNIYYTVGTDRVTVIYIIDVRRYLNIELLG